jgi:hypothetical protein
MTARAHGADRSWIPSPVDASTLRRFGVAVMNLCQSPQPHRSHPATAESPPPPAAAMAAEQ